MLEQQYNIDKNTDNYLKIQYNIERKTSKLFQKYTLILKTKSKIASQIRYTIDKLKLQYNTETKTENYQKITT